jgi:hypothetical protein
MSQVARTSFKSRFRSQVNCLLRDFPHETGSLRKHDHESNLPFPASRSLVSAFWSSLSLLDKEIFQKMNGPSVPQSFYQRYKTQFCQQTHRRNVSHRFASNILAMFNRCCVVFLDDWPTRPLSSVPFDLHRVASEYLLVRIT